MGKLDLIKEKKYDGISKSLMVEKNNYLTN